jgi:hypothetical protein
MEERKTITVKPVKCDDEEDKKVVVASVVRDKPNYNIALVLVTYCLLTGLSLYVAPSVYMFVYQRDIIPQKARYDMKHEGVVNTTSTFVTEATITRDDAWWVRHSLLIYLYKYDYLNILCMHHLDVTSPVRFCVLRNENNFYTMQNPRLVGYSKGPDLKTAVMQKSLACPSILQKERLNVVYVEWEDEKRHVHYMAVRNQLAFDLQLIMDEFVGNKHCL